MATKPARRPLSKRQQEAYDEIKAYVKRTGEWPSYRELASIMGLKSPHSITQILGALQKKNWIEKHDTYYDFAEERMYLTDKKKQEIVNTVKQAVENSSLSDKEKADLLAQLKSKMDTILS